MILPAGFNHLEESFSYIEVQFKKFCLPVKTSSPPAKTLIKLLDYPFHNKHGCFHSLLPFTCMLGLCLGLSFIAVPVTFHFVLISRTKMASSHGDHTVRVVDCKTCKCVKTLKGHPRTPWCITFHPSSDQLLASGCLGGQVRVWNLEVTFVTTCTCNHNIVHSIHVHAGT